MTLTYGKGRAGDADHERAAILTYSDPQKYLKLLRRHGYPVRYFIAGEYGSKKGRAHWHALLYWQGKPPEHLIRENMMEEHWPHGWSFWDKVTPASALYCAKYVQQDKTDDARQGMIRMSKKPPLGSEYFRQVAETYVEQGIAPQTLDYTFPGVMWSDKGHKVPWRFRLKDRPAEMFLEHFVATWKAVHGTRHVPSSELVEEFMDPSAWKERTVSSLKPLTREELREREIRNPPVNDNIPMPKGGWGEEQFEVLLGRTMEIIATNKAKERRNG